MLLQALKLAFARANIHIIFGIYKQIHNKIRNNTKVFVFLYKIRYFSGIQGTKNGNKCILNTIIS